MNVFLLICAAVVFAAVLFTYWPQSTYGNGMIFAVTLPGEAARHEEIERIRSRFRKEIRNWSLLLLALLLPMLFLGESFGVVYFLFWLFAAVLLLVIPFRRAHRETLSLKRKHDWFTSRRRVVHADLRASRSKNDLAAPVGLFALPVALSIGNLVWLARSGQAALGVAAVAVVLLAVFLNVVFRNAKTKVYSENSDLNVRLNQESRRIWSYTFLILAWTEAVHFLLIGWAATNPSPALDSLLLAVSAAFALIPLGLLLSAHFKIKRMVEDSLEADGAPVYSDDDEYWGNGFTYHNPNDPRVFVEKRVGVGMTVNTGTTAGKWFMGMVLGIAAAVLIGVSALAIGSELSPPAMTVTEEKHIHIDYMMYSTRFAADEMEEIALVRDLPRGRRINGEATGKAARGHFNLDGIGRARLFVYKDNPPYIRIRLAEETIFYNEKDPQLTTERFEQLSQLVRR